MTFARAEDLTERIAVLGIEATVCYETPKYGGLARLTYLLPFDGLFREYRNAFDGAVAVAEQSHSQRGVQLDAMLRRPPEQVPHKLSHRRPRQTRRRVGGAGACPHSYY